MYREKTRRGLTPQLWGLTPLGLTLLISASCFTVFAADQEEVKVERDEKGVIIHKDQRLVIPEDRKVIQVASNVIRAEEEDQYVKRKIDELETKVAELENRLTLVEEKVKQV